MPESIDRRDFLSRGLRTAAGLTVIGGGASGLLAACGSSNTGSSASANTGVSTASPKPGGKVVFGVGSEDNSMDPSTGRFDTTGYLYAGAVFDPLTAIDPQGRPQPYLAQSVVPNADYTSWTITLRPGINFHDGTPCDAAAVKFNLDNLVSSVLVGPEFSDIENVTTSGPLTVVVNMKSPWVPFPYHLAGQPGFVASPKMLQDKANGGMHPVGTGPFIFQEWVPNDHFSVKKNPNYWRRGLPYLDALEFKPIIDQSPQENALRAGSIDILSTMYPQIITDARSDPTLAIVDDSKQVVGEQNLNFIMLNLSVPPTDDIRVRQAMAYATNNQALWNALADGIGNPTNSLFQEGSPYQAQTSYPSYNPSKARSLVQEYQREKGPISLQLGAIPSSFVVAADQLIQQQWKSVGIQANILQTEQAQYILNAVEGHFQANVWQQFGVNDPDANYVFWAPANGSAVGQFGLQFPRNKDPLVQQAIDQGRTQSNPNARIAAYQEVAKRFAEDLPYIWLTRAVSAVAARSYVQNFANPTFPNGQNRLGLQTGIVQTAQIWRSS